MESKQAGPCKGSGALEMIAAGGRKTVILEAGTLFRRPNHLLLRCTDRCTASTTPRAIGRTVGTPELRL